MSVWIHMSVQGVCEPMESAGMCLWIHMSTQVCMDPFGCRCVYGTVCVHTCGVPVCLGMCMPVTVLELHGPMVLEAGFEH